MAYQFPSRADPVGVRETALHVGSSCTESHQHGRNLCVRSRLSEYAVATCSSCLRLAIAQQNSGAGFESWASAPLRDIAMRLLRRIRHEFTAVACSCSRCGVIRLQPLASLPAMARDLSLPALSAILHCSECGGPLTVRPYGEKSASNPSFDRAS
jgi:hypothetical protein